MEFSQQLTNMVSVLGSKETMLGYASEATYYFRIFVCLFYLKHLFLLQSKEEKYFINNHLSFRVMYHKDLETDSARIVGFEVTPNRCENLFLFCFDIWHLLPLSE